MQYFPRDVCDAFVEDVYSAIFSVIVNLLLLFLLSMCFKDAFRLQIIFSSQFSCVWSVLQLLNCLLVIITASKDRSVGVYRLGGPSHGSTEYKEVR